MNDQVKRGADVLIVASADRRHRPRSARLPDPVFLATRLFDLHHAPSLDGVVGASAKNSRLTCITSHTSDTLQERALYHIARKTQASQIIEGNLGGDGLVALADSESESSSLMLTLARAIATTTTEKHLSAETDGEGLVWQSLSLADLATPQLTAKLGGQNETMVVNLMRTPLTLEEMRARLMGQPKLKSRSPRKAPTDGATQLDLFDLLDRALGG